MPAGVTDARSAAGTGVEEDVSSASHRRLIRSGLPDRLADVDLAGQRRVEVVDVHKPVRAAGVDVSRVAAARWREVTPDQRLQHAMSAERDQRGIVRMRRVVGRVIGFHAVVKVADGQRRAHFIVPLRAGHLAQIPQLHRLVLAVAQHVPAVTLAVDVGQALGVAEEHARLASIRHAAAVPHLQRGVVRARVEDMRRRLVAVADGVDVPAMTMNLQDGLSRLDIVDVDGVTLRARHQLAAISRETDRPDLGCEELITPLITLSMIKRKMRAGQCFPLNTQRPQ